MTENSVFVNLAKYYDLIYNDKNYEKETDFIELLFEKYLKPKKILELGCGTGNYTKVFCERGYDVTGLDFSEQMLMTAKKKCGCNFFRSDIRDFSLHKKFDCCLALFNVMGYMTDNSSIEKVLAKIQSHLVKGGLFIFDVWNGLAVIKTLPEDRVKKVQDNEFEITRYAHPTLKPFDHICQVDYKIIVKEKGSTDTYEIAEKHSVRFFFPQEIKYYLEKNGFEILKICPFMDFDGEVTEDVWNMTIVAKAV